MNKSVDDSSKQSENEAKGSEGEISNLLLLEKIEGLNNELHLFKKSVDLQDEIKSLEIGKQIFELKLILHQWKWRYATVCVFFFILMSWASLLGTGSWWKWWAFLWPDYHHLTTY